jgi:acetyl esterase/lipase
MEQPEIIDVWPGQVPDAELWHGIAPEREAQLPSGGRLVRNVSTPSLTAWLPDPALANGTGVIVCPGGAFHFLAIDQEGTNVAHWLTARGFAAIVLKYRLVPTPDDEAFQAIAANPTPHRPQMDRVRPMVIADALQALRTVRSQADRWRIAPDRLGILGFSAGAYAAVGAAMKYQDPESRPDFAASVYGEWWDCWIPADAPPLFLTAARDDPLIDLRSNTSLYEAWYAAGRRVELHLYARGGHGFALVPQQLPSDGWIDRFLEWLRAEDLAPKENAR